MGSKKHKKESKKKKHRSRSRSPLDVEERERKRHHKKHKDRKKDRSPDVEEVPVDSHLLPPEDATSSRSRSSSAQRHTSREHEKEQSPSTGGAAQESLSIEESNRLRAKLGLKPLDFTEKTADDGKIKDDLGEFYHKPAGNIAQQKKADKLREKLEVRREKRKLEQKLQTTLLAEESEDEDAIAWVKKSREIEEQKKAAEKRAALLDELDAEFGVAALVQEQQEQQAQAQQTRYSHAHLKGLRVAHDIHALGEEREVVLTLADAPVLAEDAEDVLVNVNMLDDERYNKNILERKKAAAGYQAYDEEAEVAAALGLARPLLAKYDDEIDKDKPDKKKGFRIGDDDSIEANKFRDLMRQERLASAPGRRLESLQLPALRPAADYLDEHEIQAKFKKPKKKGKMRQRAKAEPIDVDDYEAGALPLHTDDTEVKPEQLTLAAALQQEEEEEPECELQAALDRARRLRLAHRHHTEIVPKVEKLLEWVKEEEGGAGGGSIVLDATAEFCRTLGDIPTYGQAGNRDQHAEIMEMEQEEGEGERGAGAGPGPEAGGAWSRVDVHSEQAPDLAAGSSVALDAEPALGGGVAGALQLALSKGYLEKAGTAPAPRTAPHHLAARHYSIEDKSHAGEDDKYGRRERGGHSGPLQEFRERSGFRPHVKLEYVDDEGRPLCPKEAFRYLSHKFHGKGPGKNKQEKRIKKAVQEGLMKKMSSTDTPLGTLQMLQEKQRETHSPYVVLSGAKREHK